MAKIVILCGMLFVVVAEKDSIPVKVACSSEVESYRENFIEKSRCALKEVFVDLKVKAAHEQFSPRAVWVNRCVGLCDYDSGNTCEPTSSVFRNVTIKIYNAKTNKESCAMYLMEEHAYCGCGNRRQMAWPINSSQPEREVDVVYLL